MPRKRLLWQLYPSYLAVSLAALAAVGWFASRQVREFHMEHTASNLEARSKLIARHISNTCGLDDPAEVDALCKVLGKDGGVRVTVIDPAGRVLGDSHEDPAKMENHLGPERPEVMRALDSEVGVSPSRYSETLKQNMAYVAVPLTSKAKTVAAVRTALPITDVEAALRSLYVDMAFGLLIVAALIAAVSLFASRRISRPLEDLKRGAERFARGDLEHRLPVPDVAETGSLAESMNQMAAQLDDKIARLRRLETVRRDFVANVSHELKTPLTPIRAAIETLQEGSYRDEEEAKNFVDMIARQSHRLGAIIEDLLELSRIEEEEEKYSIELASELLEPVIKAAVESCSTKALRKKVSVEIDCPEDLRGNINPPLLENAIANLVDNAIKYSGDGSRVWVNAKRADGEMLISVRDEGCGIAHEHLPRLFERFYRVDKARSRKLGGTGLGLAIVKHIAQLHGGRTAVESSPGKGSVFTLHLPGGA